VFTPERLSKAKYLVWEDAAWEIDKAVEAWEADRQRLEEAEKVREAVKQDIANGHMRGTMPLTIAALAAHVPGTPAGEEKPDGWILSDGHRAGHG
jgi:hypothetical protein